MIDQRSIAVLPFDNLSSDPENEYFSDGMTEEIINALSRIEGLKVTARTSSFAFKNQKEDVRIIGNKLGVSSVLEGSIRKSGNRVRITAQLIRTDNGFHLWSENFDRNLDDIFALQDEISLLIADKVRENFGHFALGEHLVEPQTHNVEAYNLYLKGRYYQLKWDKAGFEKAVEYYEQSLALDPDYPLPHLAASITYSYLSCWNFMPKEEGEQLAAQNLSQVDQSHAGLEAFQFAKSTKAFWLDWNLTESNRSINEALKLFPNSTDLLELGAEIMTAQGRFEEGIVLIDKALTLNPLSPNHHFTKGNIYYLWGKFDKAIQAFNEGIAIDPYWILAIRIKACCYLALKDADGLENMMSEIAEPAIQDYYRILFRLITHQETKASLSADQELDYIPWHVLFLLYSGQVDQAMEKLEWGVKGRIGQYINFAFDALLAPLRNHERYKALREAYINITDEPEPVVSETKDIEKPEAKLTATEVQEYSDLLQRMMEEDKAFLDSALSLRQLAASLDIHPNKLSWLINDQLGKNFNEYVNHFRLKEFQRQALLAENKHITLLGLAYDSGFNSKSVFNDFFKKQTGTTPKAWVKAQS